MKPIDHHPSQFGRAPRDTAVLTDQLPDDAPVIRGREADCCPAQPLYRVVVPASDTRARSTDLYLCGHHRRQCRDGLAAARVMVFDAFGRLIAND